MNTSIHLQPFIQILMYFYSLNILSITDYCTLFLLLWSTTLTKINFKLFSYSLNEKYPPLSWAFECLVPSLWWICINLGPVVNRESRNTETILWQCMFQASSSFLFQLYGWSSNGEPDAFLLCHEDHKAFIIVNQINSFFYKLHCSRWRVLEGEWLIFVFNHSTKHSIICLTWFNTLSI